MTVDVDTVFLVCGLVVVLCGTTFILETLLRRNDVVGRIWSVFFVALMFTVFAYLVAGAEAELWWAGGVANGAYVTALGLLWAGARRANGRRAFIAVPVLGGILVALAAIVRGPDGGPWAGSVEMFLVVALFALLGVAETARGRLGRLPSAHVLASMLGVYAVYYVGRAVALVVLGPDDAFFELFFGTSASTLVEVALVVIGTITLSSIQGDRFRRLTELEAETGARVRLDGAVGAGAFRDLAESWLVRSIRQRSTLVLLLVDVTDLQEINLAYGRAAGDATIRAVGRLVLGHAPTASLVGHLSARRFAILTELPVNDSIEAIADRIGDAVLDARIDDQDRFRASTFRGITKTRTVGARYDDLMRAAADALEVHAASIRGEDDRARR